MALTADVVIIGGGVIGASIAHHLTARGMRERGRDRQELRRLRRHREELGLRPPALLHRRDLPHDPLRARLLRALRGADGRRIVRLPAHRLPARGGRAHASPDGDLGGAAASAPASTPGSSRPTRCARSSRGSRRRTGWRAATSPPRATAIPSRPPRASRGPPARAARAFSRIRRRSASSPRATA